MIEIEQSIVAHQQVWIDELKSINAELLAVLEAALLEIGDDTTWNIVQNAIANAKPQGEK